MRYNRANPFSHNTMLMKNNDKTTLESPGKLLEDLRALVAEAEKLMRNAAGDTPAEGDPGSLKNRLDRTQIRLGELYSDTRDRFAAGAKSADASVRANPYQSLAIAAGIGLLVGVMTRRSSK